MFVYTILLLLLLLLLYIIILGLFNVFGVTGPLGFIPNIADWLHPFRLVKVDPNDPSVPYRHPTTGYCTLCAYYEPGLLIGGLNSSDCTRRYDGYSDAKATQSKVLKDVFRKGDAYFNTGDLLYRDYWGHYYWSDRVGDTYRWKGENVSTTEVSLVINSVTQFQENCVYGVEIPGTDGKAGMVAVVLKEGVNSTEWDVQEVKQEVTKHLPIYARPLFLRIKEDRKLPVTTTHKYIKTGLVKQGFDSKNVEDDKLYYWDNKTNNYQLLSEEIYDAIQKKSLKF
jgi:hypothetical protein